MGHHLCSITETSPTIEVNVAAGLPAKFLLLFQFTVGEEMTRVELLTDCWMALRHVDSLLENVFA